MGSEPLPLTTKDSVKYNPSQIPKNSQQASEKAASHVFHRIVPQELALNEESIKLERTKSHSFGKEAAERGRTKTPISYTCCFNEHEAELTVL